MADEPVPLSTIALDLPAPLDGWPVELERRGVVVFEDDLGRPAVERAVARALFTEHRANEARVARAREEHERQLVAADEARRAAIPKGIPVSAEVPGLSAALLMMAADPMDQGSRRESVLEHALSNPAGAIVYRTVEGGAS
jgi:hypothetical protein